MKHFAKILILACTVGLTFSGCGSKDTPSGTSVPVFAKGADVGWITEMEHAGVKFYNGSGTEQDIIQILKDKGINSIRLRAWVNPPDGWNNTKDLVVKAKRAQELGMRLMIDFHYSDTWADPAKQPIPKAWSAMNIDQAKLALYDYTVGVMDTLRLNGIRPEWVQVGNETNDGMMWELGRASASIANFAELIAKGYDAVKSVSPDTKVIVHLSNGYDSALFRGMFDGLKANHAKWDIIGMSLYPTWAPQGVAGWAKVNEQCLANMKDMIVRYGTPVMIVEVGMPASDPASSKLFLADIIAKTKSIENNNGLGVFYWEPECYKKWNGYDLGAFDDNGKPTAAMDAFLE